MDLQIARHQPDLAAGAIARIDGADAILRRSIETRIAHLQRVVVERFRVGPPGPGPMRMIFEADGAANQMRLMRGIAEIVVETAWAGIGPMQDAVHIGEVAFQPQAVVQRHVECVQTGAAIHPDGLIAGHAQLHADGLKQCFCQFENFRAPLECHWLLDGTVEYCGSGCSGGRWIGKTFRR